jgi:diaminopropionate ammonia-lyase
MCRYCHNRFRKEKPSWDDRDYDTFAHDDILDFHRSLAEYRPTPIIRLPALACKLGVKNIYVKDESYRFGLNAFKVLGASYAIYLFMKQAWEEKYDSFFDIQAVMDDGPKGKWAGRYTFCTATDGNHGRAVAWTAKKFYQKAVIYMPKGTASARIENIRAEGSDVHIIDGTYDDAVRQIVVDAAKNGWQVISDTAYKDYITIPGWIMAGYTTMFKEMEPENHTPDIPNVDYVFMQAGVGSFAAAGTWYYVNRYGKKRPQLISVEPIEAACMLESISSKNGRLTTSHGSFNTIMAGLNCGTPSLLAWPIIREGIDLFLAISDNYAINGMRQYYYPLGDDPHIVSGESGAAGLAALTALMTDDNLQEAKEKLGLNSKSRILLFNTEGATDPVNFEKVILK